MSHSLLRLLRRSSTPTWTPLFLSTLISTDSEFSRSFLLALIERLISSTKMTNNYLSWVAARAERVSWRPQGHCQSTKWWGAACPHSKCHTPPRSQANLCNWSWCHQVLLLVPCVSPEGPRKSSWEIVYFGQVFKKSHLQWRTLASGCSMTPWWHPKHVPGVTGPDHCRLCHPMLSRRGCPALHTQPHQIQIMKVEEIAAGKCCPLAAKQFQLQDQVPAAPMGPVSLG